MKLKLIVIFGMITALVYLLSFPPVSATQKIVSFKGDIIIAAPDSIIKAKLYVKGPHIRRVEMSEKDGGMIFICPKEARGKVWMLDPTKKQYKILTWPENHKDPVSAWTDIQYDMSGGVVGNDTINGHPCTVYQFKYPGNDSVALKMWFAEDIRYGIKREADAKIAMKKNENQEAIRGTFQINNIKIEEIDDALFIIPSNYKEIK